MRGPATKPHYSDHPHMYARVHDVGYVVLYVTGGTAQCTLACPKQNVMLPVLPTYSARGRNSAEAEAALHVPGHHHVHNQAWWSNYQKSRTCKQGLFG